MWRVLSGFGGGEPFLARRVVYCPTFVVAWRFLPDVCGGEPCRADVACWGVGDLILPALAKSAPTSPAHPAIPARLAALRVGADKMQGFLLCSSLRFCQPLSAFWFAFTHCLFFPRDSGSGAGAHGIARQRVSRSDNLCSQCAEDGSFLFERRRGGNATSTTPLLNHSLHGAGLGLVGLA